MKNHWGRKQELGVVSATELPLSPEDLAGVRVRAESARACSQQLFATCMRLRIALEAGAANPHIDLRPERRLCLEAESALRDRVKDFASQLRRIQTAPEEMVVRVKQLVRDGLAQAPNAPQYAARDLGVAVVRWAIDGYFAR